MGRDHRRDDADVGRATSAQSGDMARTPGPPSRSPPPRRPAGALASVSGTPSSLLKDFSLAVVRRAVAESAAAARSLVDVLPDRAGDADHGGGQPIPGRRGPGPGGPAAVSATTIRGRRRPEAVPLGTGPRPRRRAPRRRPPSTAASIHSWPSRAARKATNSAPAAAPASRCRRRSERWPPDRGRQASTRRLPTSRAACAPPPGTSARGDLADDRAAGEGQSPGPGRR